MTNHARETLDRLVNGLDGEAIVKTVRRRLFSDGCDIPSLSWSFLNQLAVVLANTQDARGIRQWRQAGRSVNKGARAFYILAPILVTTGPDDNCDSDPVHIGMDTTPSGHKVCGYRSIPVFRFEDTHGKALPYEVALRDFSPDRLPLFEVAQHLGISVTPSLTRGIYGAYSHRQKAIRLGTDDPLVFLHELSHAIDASLPGKSPDYAFGEIVAELSAAFLGSLYGAPPILSDVKAYIESYAGKGHVAFKISAALSRTEQIYSFIERFHATHPEAASEEMTLGALPLFQAARSI